MENPGKSRMHGKQYERFQEYADSVARSDIAAEIEDERNKEREKIAKERGLNPEEINKKPLSKIG